MPWLRKAASRSLPPNDPASAALRGSRQSGVRYDASRSFHSCMRWVHEAPRQARDDPVTVDLSIGTRRQRLTHHHGHPGERGGREREHGPMRGADRTPDQAYFTSQPLVAAA